MFTLGKILDLSKILVNYLALFSNFVAFGKKKADYPCFSCWHSFVFLRKELQI
jgi:hypothetical protein